MPPKNLTKKVTFTNRNGEALAGRLELPLPDSGIPTGAYALFAHCFSCSKDILAAARISKALTRHGIGVLRFDFTGLGHSEGAFSNTNFSSNVDDLVCAAEFLRNHYAAPQLLIGHSLGGSAVIVAARQIAEVRAVATIAAPSNPQHLLTLLEDQLPAILEGGKARVCIAGRNFTIKKQLIDDIASHQMEEHIQGLNRPLLVLHAPSDDTVGIEHAEAIFAAANHPKGLIALEGADHLLTRKEDAHYVARLLSAWASRYTQLDQLDGDLE